MVRVSAALQTAANMDSSEADELCITKISDLVSSMDKLSAELCGDLLELIISIGSRADKIHCLFLLYRLVSACTLASIIKVGETYNNPRELEILIDHHKKCEITLDRMRVLRNITLNNILSGSLKPPHVNILPKGVVISTDFYYNRKKATKKTLIDGLYEIKDRLPKENNVLTKFILDAMNEKNVIKKTRKKSNASTNSKKTLSFLQSPTRNRAPTKHYKPIAFDTKKRKSPLPTSNTSNKVEEELPPQKRHRVLQQQHPQPQPKPKQQPQQQRRQLLQKQHQPKQQRQRQQPSSIDMLADVCHNVVVDRRQQSSKTVISPPAATRCLLSDFNDDKSTNPLINESALVRKTLFPHEDTESCFTLENEVSNYSNSFRGSAFRFSRVIEEQQSHRGGRKYVTMELSQISTLIIGIVTPADDSELASMSNTRSMNEKDKEIYLRLKNEKAKLDRFSRSAAGDEQCILTMASESVNFPKKYLDFKYHCVGNITEHDGCAHLKDFLKGELLDHIIFAHNESYCNEYLYVDSFFKESMPYIAKHCLRAGGDICLPVFKDLSSIFDRITAIKYYDVQEVRAMDETLSYERIISTEVDNVGLSNTSLSFLKCIAKCNHENVIPLLESFNFDLSLNAEKHSVIIHLSALNVCKTFIRPGSISGYDLSTAAAEDIDTSNYDLKEYMPMFSYRRSFDNDLPCAMVVFYKPESTKGYGVFATRDLTCGEFLFEYTGEIVNLKENYDMTYVIEVDDDTFIDATLRGNVSRFLDETHEHPNVEAKKIVVNGTELVWKNNMRPNAPASSISSSVSGLSAILISEEPVYELAAEDLHEPPLAPTKTISERVYAAKAACNPGARGFPLVGRDAQLTKLLGLMRTAVSDGSGKGIYLCGLSGVGKTATVEEAVRTLEAEEQSLNPFTMIRATGTGLQQPFRYLAEKMNWRGKATRWNENVAREICLKHFEPAVKSSAADANRMFILFIDEVDKVAKPAVKALFSTAAAANSRLVLIGVANNINFPLELKLADHEIPVMITFNPLTVDDLKAILHSRCPGLFDKWAANLLVMKVNTKGGDVRLLCDLASGTLTRAAARCTTLEELSDACIVKPTDVSNNFDDVGLGTSRNSKFVRDLPAPARTFLVSLVLDRHGKEKELMNFPEMLRAVNTYTAQIGWPGFSREEGLKAFDALQTYSLLQGGVTKYHPLGNHDELRYRVAPTIKEMLWVEKLEDKHKAQLEKLVAVSSTRSLAAELES